MVGGGEVDGGGRQGGCKVDENEDENGDGIASLLLAVVPSSLWMPVPSL